MAVLPVQTSPFVGRRDDVGELGRLISAVRLVTLCGTGGIGKTRLALQVAEETVEVFPDGVWLVELAELEPSAGLIERVAASLRVEAGGSARDAVTAALGKGRQLLVLDNCEHVVDAAADLVGHLLRSCPELTIVATSREPLRVAGENLYRVPPLSLDGGDAEELFALRARAAAPERGVDERTVRELCADLEGIPLAIELAAAMTRVLSVDQIRARLTDRFRLLSGGPRTAPARQRTLLATVEWSYEMLSPDAQSLLRQLSVFRGAWTLDMAELSCQNLDNPLEAMAELVDKSLILGDGEVAGQVCYRMLDTVREYVRRLLGPEGERDLRDRHLRFTAELAERGNRMADEVTWETRAEAIAFWAMLQAVQPNLFAALAHAADSGRAQDGLRLLVSIQWEVIGQGLYEEYAVIADRLLAAAPDAPAPLRAQVLALRAVMSMFAGDHAGTVRLTQESIALCSEPGPSLVLASIPAAAFGVPGGLPLDRALELAEDRQTRAGVLNAQAMIAQLQGRTREAAEFYEALPEVFGGCHDWLNALSALGLAQLARDRGDLTGALRQYEAAHAILYAPDYPLDCRGERLRCLTGIAEVATLTGDLETAQDRIREALALTRDLGDRAASADLVATAARISSCEGDHGRAVLLAAAVQAVRARLGLQAAGTLAQEIVEPARAAIGEHETARLWAEGEALTWPRALAYLTSELPTSRPAPAGAPARPPTVLTERETEVARLVARGLSNKRIAEDLFISPATVARHITNILSKLGFASRAQIAAWHTSRTRP